MFRTPGDGPGTISGELERKASLGLRQRNLSKSSLGLVKTTQNGALKASGRLARCIRQDLSRLGRISETRAGRPLPGRRTPDNPADRNLKRIEPARTQLVNPRQNLFGADANPFERSGGSSALDLGMYFVLACHRTVARLTNPPKPTRSKSAQGMCICAHVYV